MRAVFCSFLLTGVLLQAAGCATLTKGSTQVIPVTSSPSNATVIVDGAVTHTTPCSLCLTRKTGHSLVFQKPGYEEFTYMIQTQSSAAIAGNILFGGVIGLGVDAATGASNDLVPPSVHVALTPLGPGEVQEARVIPAEALIVGTEPCDISSLPAATATENVSVAVIDFSVGLEMKKESGRALSDLCRNVVQQSNRHDLLDRENMIDVLGEQDFAATVKCDETRCLVEYGKLLSVQRMLYGRISSLGSSYVVYLSLTDVETGRIGATITEQVQSDMDGVGRIMPTLACNLLKASLPEVEEGSASHNEHGSSIEDEMSEDGTFH